MTELTSVVANAGWSSSAISIVGTPPAKSARSLAISARTRAGSKAGGSTSVPWKASDPSTAIAQPAAW